MATQDELKSKLGYFDKTLTGLVVESDNRFQEEQAGEGQGQGRLRSYYDGEFHGRKSALQAFRDSFSDLYNWNELYK